VEVCVGLLLVIQYVRAVECVTAAIANNVIYSSNVLNRHGELQSDAAAG